MRIVSLDIGTKRIGVASTGPMGDFPEPRCVINRKGGVGDLEKVFAVISELDPGLIVIGLPLGAEGEEGPAAFKIKRFTERLKTFLCERGTHIPIEFYDERYSTSIATERLVGFDVPRKRRREVIDKMAALVILEGYLESVVLKK
jgi:putative Holliday junction resolvase